MTELEGTIRSSNHDKPPTLFSDVKFIIAQCNETEAIKNLLISGGAKHINYLSEHVTLVISDTNCPEAEEAVDLFDKPVVNSLWVYLSLKANKLLPTEAFSPIKAIFQNVIASFSPRLTRNDIEVLASALTFYGARLSKDATNATHLIVASAADDSFSEKSDKNKPSQTINDNIVKIVAPDWVIDSVKSKRCCDEQLFDPNFLLPPPPPTPPKLPTPPPQIPLPAGQQPFAQANNHSQQSLSQQQLPQQTLIQTSQVPVMHPRPQFQPNFATSGPNVQHVRTPRATFTTASTSTATTIINHQHELKANNITNRHPNPNQISSGTMVKGPRLPNHLNHQPGPLASAGVMYPRGVPPGNVGPMQKVNVRCRFYSKTSNNCTWGDHCRFEHRDDSPNPADFDPRPPPPAGLPGSNIGTGRGPMGSASMGAAERVGAPTYPSYSSSGSIRHHQPPYPAPQPHGPGYPSPYDAYGHPHPHHSRSPPLPLPPHQQQQWPRQQQTIINHQHELKANNITNRHPNPNQVSSGTMVKGPRLPNSNINNSNNSNNIQPKPHPSIFNHIQESNLAQIKAKVPNVTEAKNYLGHDPRDNVPNDLPFIGCKFKLIDYETTNPKKREQWCEAIKLAGGSFDESIENLTHLICEDRNSATYSDAIKQGVRVITIYWISDVLANNKMSYPWKALHFPLPFSKANRPLKNEIITITNVKGRDRRELIEMILKSGARYTDYLGPSNTLIICGDVGGEKYERAIELKIPFANCQLLTDVLLDASKDLRLMLSHTKYQLFNHEEPFKITSYSEVLDLMKPWTKAVSINIKEVGRIEALQISNGDTVKTTSLSSNDDSGIAAIGGITDDLDGGITNKTSIILNGDDNKLINQKELELKPQVLDKVKIDLVVDNNALEKSEQIVIETQDNPGIDFATPTGKDIVAEVKPAIDELNNRLNKDELKNDGKIQGLDIGSPLQNIRISDGKEISPQIDRIERKSTDPIRILFTHLDQSLVQKLKIHSLELGMGFATSPINCTHLIVDRLSRTPKFICAFSHASYILSYNWIVESHEAKHLLDEKQFILQDKSGEEKYCVNLGYSLSKRKKRDRPLFSNFVFFVTPTVLNSVINVKEMIESAGGIVATKKLPSKMQIDQLKADKKSFVMVTCKQDLHLCSSLENNAIDIVSPEFVISGILRQDIDFEAHRLKTSKATTFVHPETINSTAQISQPSPPKKSRLNDSSC